MQQVRLFLNENKAHDFQSKTVLYYFIKKDPTKNCAKKSPKLLNMVQNSFILQKLGPFLVQRI